MNNEYTIIDFWAKWCGPCKQFVPIFDTLSNTLSSAKLTFEKVNVDDDPDRAATNNVMTLPTVILYHNGKEVNRLVGKSVTKDKVIDLLKPIAGI